MRYMLSFCLISAFFLVYLGNRKKLFICCEQLMRQLRPYQLRNRDHIIEHGPQPDVLDMTDGLQGIWARWRNRKVFLGLCQIRIQRHSADPKEIEYVTRRAARLTAVTLVLIIVYPFRRFFPVYRLAFIAYKLYAEIADRTHSFYALDDEPVCSLRLAELL